MLAVTPNGGIGGVRYVIINRRSLSVTKLKREGRAPVTKLKAGSPVTKLTGGPVTKLQRKVLNLVAYKLLFLRGARGCKKSVPFHSQSIRALHSSLVVIPVTGYIWKLKVCCVMRPCR